MLPPPSSRYSEIGIAMQKVCFKCGEEKPLSMYYKHSKMMDGHLNKCIECAKKDVRKHREENLEKIQQYDRHRNSLEHRVKAREEYRKTEAYIESHKKALIKQYEKFPEKRSARSALYNALRDKKINPWPICSIPSCNKKPEAHHVAYSMPLDVVWLCKEHHVETHKIAKELIRQEKKKEKK